MDNITHSLVGVLIGARAASKEEKAFWWIVGASVVANNFPDADVLYASRLSQPLGTLLHHRGHTHTLLGAAACGVVCAILIFVFGRFRGQKFSRGATQAIVSVSLLGAFVHILLDSLNTYGVHPFWPLDNHWYYGDTVFIIEPTLWITLAAAGLASPSLSRLRWGFALILLGASALIAFSGYVPPTLIFVYAGAFIILLLLSRTRERNRRAALWIRASIAMLFIFFVSGRIAERMRPSTASTSEQLMTFFGPSPANPLCWSALEMRRTADRVVYEQEFIQPLGKFFTVPCAKYSIFREPTSWEENSASWSIPLSLFQSVADNCRWKALLQFARTPSLESLPEGRMNGADIRFTRRGKTSFAKIPLEGSCPEQLPPWLPPIEPERLR